MAARVNLCPTITISPLKVGHRSSSYFLNTLHNCMNMVASFGTLACMHSSGLLGGVAAEVDECIGGVARLARLIPLGGFSPGGLADAPLALASASSMRVVHRIHGHATRLSHTNKKILRYVHATAQVQQHRTATRQAAKKACAIWPFHVLHHALLHGWQSGSSDCPPHWPPTKCAERLHAHQHDTSCKLLPRVMGSTMKGFLS